MIPCVILFLDNLGGGELLLIFIVSLLFFGSKSIPEMAKGMGKVTREFRNAMNDVRSEIETSINTPQEEKTNSPKIKEGTNSDNSFVEPISETPTYVPPPRKVFGQGDQKE